MTRSSSIGLALSRQVSRARTAPHARYLAFLEPFEELAEADEVPLLAVMAAIWMLRPDLQKLWPLQTREQRFGFLGWCLSSGLREYAVLREAMQRPQIRALYLAPTELEAQYPGGNIPLPYAALAVRAFSADLARATPLDRSEGRQQLLAWYFKHIFNGLSPFFPHPRWLVDLVERVCPAGVNVPEAPELPVQPDGASPAYPSWAYFGVNVVGHLFGQLGIGEDARCASRALADARVDHCVIDFPAGPNVETMPHAYPADAVDSPVYPLNLLVMTGMETLRLFCERGTQLFHGRYTIGLWPWELPRWPRELEFCFSLVDEVWAISAHVRGAYELASPVPVVHMPSAVTAEPVEASRKRFGLPDGKFVFLTYFDALSSFHRKNPMAAIEAFRDAFPGDDSVRLVVKVMRGAADGARMDELNAAAKADSRLIVVDAVLKRHDLLQLLASSDCLVSLHRAEGFGRSLAEAVLLGRKVVATYWSGNVDFALAGNQLLVEADMVDVPAGHYPWADGQYWAEPRHSAAVEALRAARYEPQEASGEAEAFRPVNVGTRYAQRLDAIYRRIAGR
ncbi:glycosyltransferase [Pseudochelatococcus sp. B33]